MQSGGATKTVQVTLGSQPDKAATTGSGGESQNPFGGSGGLVRRRRTHAARMQQGHLSDRVAGRCPCCVWVGDYASSRIVALAWPPPSHIVCRP